MPVRYEGLPLGRVRYRGAEGGTIRQFGGIVHQDISTVGPATSISSVLSPDGLSVTLTALASGEGTLRYFWRRADNTAVRLNTDDNDTDIVVTDDGTYEVVVNDDNGETIECVVVAIPNLGPTGVLTNVPPTRTPGQSITGVTVTAGDLDHPTTATWVVTFNGTSIATGTTPSLNVAIPDQIASATVGTDTYVLTVTDPDGATAVSTHDIVVDIIVTFSFTEFTETSRTGGAVTTRTIQGSPTGGAVSNRTVNGGNVGGGVSTSTRTGAIVGGTSSTRIGTGTGPITESVEQGNTVTCTAFSPATGPSTQATITQTRTCTETYNTTARTQANPVFTDISARTRTDTVWTNTAAITRTDSNFRDTTAITRVDRNFTDTAALTITETRECQDNSGNSAPAASCPSDANGIETSRDRNFPSSSVQTGTTNVTVAAASSVFTGSSNVTVRGATSVFRNNAAPVLISAGTSSQTGTSVVTLTPAVTGLTRAAGTGPDGLGTSRTIANPAFVPVVITTFSVRINGPLTGATGGSATYSAILGGSATGAVSYSWSTGGQASGGGSGASITVSYTGRGPFSVSLTATRAGLTRSDTSNGFSS